MALAQQTQNIEVPKNANASLPASTPANSALSDVDIDIPSAKRSADMTFALVISNENYKRVESVPFAINDGESVCNYLKTTLGVPQKHITQVKDATLSDIKYSLNHLRDISDAFEGDIDLIVYYSGHGIPDESDKDSYLLPVDGYAADASTALKLSDFYTQLNQLNARNVTVFLDACFSGTQKNGEMLASARGVAIKPKPVNPVGNLLVVSAAQGDQTAYPYQEKNHGMMTYFLLKKLKEAGSDVSLGDLIDYVIKSVRQTSLIENGKAQVPTVTSGKPDDSWRSRHLQR